ncbi:m-AAA protease-interacting protein 1, mitochondrial-like [Amphiura filiformis]|uniref:m-AAA protease-interacting protein 1, mitochondrial-like n=1 Tax=Amphiura filiformis TaxID=82378 RepID=UPI003B20E6B2
MAAPTVAKICQRRLLGSRHLQNAAVFMYFNPTPSAYCYGLCGSNHQRNTFLRNTGSVNAANYHNFHKLTSRLTITSRNSFTKLRTVTYVPVRDVSDRQPPKVEVAKLVPIRNPLHLIRDGLYSLLIRFYFDPEFYLAEFAKGAKQAVLYVSQQISQGAFEKVDGLLQNEVLTAMKERYTRMSAEDRNNLAVQEEDMVSYPHDILVHYDAEGATKVVKVKIRMRCIWGYSAFSNSKDISPDERLRKILHCDYEFHRDFSPGVSTAEWIISGIEYSTMKVKQNEN